MKKGCYTNVKQKQRWITFTRNSKCEIRYKKKYHEVLKTQHIPYRICYTNLKQK